MIMMNNLILAGEMTQQTIKVINESGWTEIAVAVASVIGVGLTGLAIYLRRKNK
jgi:hypothetical protein